MTVQSQQEPILNGSSKIQSLTRNSPKQMLFSIVNGKTEHISSRDKLTKPQSYSLAIHLNNIQAHDCTQLNKAPRHIKAHNIQAHGTAFMLILIQVKIQTCTHSQPGVPLVHRDSCRSWGTNMVFVIFSCLLPFRTLARPSSAENRVRTEDKAGSFGSAGGARAQCSYCSPADLRTKTRCCVVSSQVSSCEGITCSPTAISITHRGPIPS